MGYANAKIGSNSHDYERIMEIMVLGNNWGRFDDFCDFNGFLIGVFVFQHKRIHQVSWLSPDGVTQNQIDHFFNSDRFRLSLDDVRAIRGADVESDQYLLLAKF